MHTYHIETFPNGLRLVTVEMPHLHKAELVCYLNCGGRHEPPANNGISHFLEHMLFRGAGPFKNSREIEGAFEEIGGAVNASTDAESTYYHSRIHPDHVARGVEIFAAMLQKPRFCDIDIERKIILEEAREDYNQKGKQINPDNLMAELLWPDQALGMPLIGSKTSLNAIHLPTLKEYHQQHYTPHNTVISCCGAITHQQIKDAVAEAFGAWQGETPIPTQKISPQQPGPHQNWTFDSDSQITLQLAFPMAGRADKRTLLFSMLRRLLSWGGGALLPQRLREECGLTYAVEANCSLLADTGYFSIDLAIAPQNLIQALQETLNILTTLRQQAPPLAALDAARTSYLYDLEFSLDQPEAMNARYGWGVQANCLRTIAQDRHEVKQITPAQIQALSNELFTYPQLHLVVVGPWQEEQKKQAEEVLLTWSKKSGCP